MDPPPSRSFLPLKPVGAGFKPALATQARTAGLRRYGATEIARGFKTFSARRVNERADKRGVLWQRGYYERVIRNEKALDRIRAYIANHCCAVGG